MASADAHPGPAAAAGRSRGAVVDLETPRGEWAATAEEYESQLAQKVQAVSRLLAPCVDPALLELPGLEMRRSPVKHFRARTVVAVGLEHQADAASSSGLFRLVPSAGCAGLRLVANLPVETLLEPVAAALPALARLLDTGAPGAAGRTAGVLLPGLRCVKLHAALGGEPRGMLLSLVYGPDAAVAAAGAADNLDAALWDFRERLSAELSAGGTPASLAVMAQARGLQRCVPDGQDFVDEQLHIAGRGVVRYRQPFGSFSNPNPHIAVATAEWLLDVIRTSVNCGAETGTDLLELYCGAGSHTVALAPAFRHVLAVEINRHLVEGAKYNTAANGLENVTVVRAPSEEFCRRVVRRRGYELRHDDGSVKMQLRFGCTVLDPPRAGLDRVTREAVKGYDHLLYVSCNPEALRGDLEDLASTHEVRRLVLLDHFPFSAHVETAVYLRRREPAPVGAGPG